MKNTATLKLTTLDETSSLGQSLGRVAESGDVIALFGDLGAGKTTLTQFIGQGLQVPDSCYITSPTFSLLHEYPGRIPLFHMDLYRLSGEDDVIDLGFEDYLYGDGLVVIEWPDRLGALMPDNRLAIELTMTSESSRTAVFTAYGKKWVDKLAEIMHVSTKET
ncbi:MAG: tRNA (adenosine(37)-N6)-threonylcarbamoyltransferase complex ATPase subunit type 1 TsaE [Desulfobulbaceae bacterium]|nr:tRNA (adenosine(37)-N6)-threonylcarbamoyltransferase complex ATPase subunit type 1 TsaE [Desulfobulbaceae bacterium]